MAAPVWRARMLGRDLGRVARGIATTARLALREPPDAPGLALLEGPEAVRLDTASCYRVRVHNPGPEPCAVTIRLRGECRDAGVPFELHATIALAAGSAADRWLTTDWSGRAELADAHPRGPISLAIGPAIGRWALHASLEGRSGHLRIEGSIAA
jgi:hypothetical protein